MPYRPVSCVWYRGLSAHKHSMLSGMAAKLLNRTDRGRRCAGWSLSIRTVPGLVTNDGLLTAAPGSYLIHPAYPARKVVAPMSVDYSNFFQLQLTADRSSSWVF